MAIGDRIQVAQESTSEEILQKVGLVETKIDQTSGVIVDTKDKKYRPEIYKTFNVRPTISAVGNNGGEFVYFDGKYEWFSITNSASIGYWRVAQDNPTDVKSYIVSLLNSHNNLSASIGSNGNSPLSIVSKHYKGKFYFIYTPTGEANSKVGFFDTATETFTLEATTDVFNISYFADKPVIDVYDAGYFVISNRSAQSTGTVWHFLYKIDENGMATQMPLSPFQQGIATQISPAVYFMFFQDFYLRMYYSGGSTNLAIRKHNYNGTVIGNAIDVLGSNITKATPLLINGLIYLHNNNVIHTLDPVSLAVNNFTITGLTSNMTLFNIGSDIFYLSDSSDTIAFNKVLLNLTGYNPSKGIIVDAFKRGYLASGASAQPVTIYPQLNLNRIVVHAGGTGQHPIGVPFTFIIDLPGTRFSSYKEVE